MLFWIKHFFSGPEHHKDAAQEVGLVCGVALAPLLLLPLIEHLRSNLGVPATVLWQAISSGQLYLYSFALLAPCTGSRKRTEPTAPAFHRGNIFHYAFGCPQ
jgi:hypothetical protein